MPRFPAALIRALSVLPFMTLPLSAAEITVAEASHFASLALKGIRKEFPNKMDHVMNSAEDVRRPRDLHPAFYGCFDWHSSVHGHWMLVRLLRLHPGLPEAPAIREALRASDKWAIAWEPCRACRTGRRLPPCRISIRAVAASAADSG